MWHARITFRNHFNNRLNFLLSSCFLLFFFFLLQLSPKSPGNLARGSVLGTNFFCTMSRKGKTHTKEEEKKGKQHGPDSRTIQPFFCSSLFTSQPLVPRNWFDVCTMAHTKFIVAGTIQLWMFNAVHTSIYI